MAIAATRRWRIPFKDIVGQARSHMTHCSLHAVRYPVDLRWPSQLIISLTPIELASKLAISDIILEAEANSQLAKCVDRSSGKTSLQGVRNSWLHQFSAHLFAGNSLDDVDIVFDKCAFICFNYDRCIEFYLELALQNYFLIDANRAQSIVQRLKIYHPYGSLGSPYGMKAKRFGTRLMSKDELFDIARNIRTFHEGVQDNALMDGIHTSVANAETIVFLGFGFIEQNVQLLQPPVNNTMKRVFATAYRMSDENAIAARALVSKTLSSPDCGLEIDLFPTDQKSADLLDRRSMSIFR